MAVLKEKTPEILHHMCDLPFSLFKTICKHRRDVIVE